MSFNINGLDGLDQHGADRRSIEPCDPQWQCDQLIWTIRNPTEIEVFEDRRSGLEKGMVLVQRLALAVIDRRGVDAEQTKPTPGEPAHAGRRERRPRVREGAVGDRSSGAKEKAFDAPWQARREGFLVHRPGRFLESDDEGRTDEGLRR